MSIVSEVCCRLAASGRAAPVIASLALGMLWAQPAAADCAAPVPAVLWSSPSANDIDVPIDADLMLVTEQMVLTTATLTLTDRENNDVTLEPASSGVPGHYELGELEPNQPYTVEIRPAVGGLVTLPFSTGEDRAPVAPDAALEIRSGSERELIDVEAEECANILFANTCYDQGPPPPVQTFQPDAGSSPVSPDSLWAILTIGPSGISRVTTWPASCGSPRQFASTLESAHFQLYNVSPNGSMRVSDLVDVSTLASNSTGTAPQTDTSGCALAARPSGAIGGSVLAVVLGLLGLCTRRRSPRSWRSLVHHHFRPWRTS